MYSAGMKNHRSHDAETVMKKSIALSADGALLEGVYEMRLHQLKDVGKSDKSSKGGKVSKTPKQESPHPEEPKIRLGSPEHKASLEAGTEHMAAIKVFLAIVREPKAYQLIDKAFMLKESRIDGLPDDDARKSFRARKLAMASMDCSDMTDIEKKIFEERRENMDTAEKSYIDLQKKALGIT